MGSPKNIRGGLAAAARRLLGPLGCQESYSPTGQRRPQCTLSRELLLCDRTSGRALSGSYSRGRTPRLSPSPPRQLGCGRAACGPGRCGLRGEEGSRRQTGPPQRDNTRRNLPSTMQPNPGWWLRRTHRQRDTILKVSRSGQPTLRSGSAPDAALPTLPRASQALFARLDSPTGRPVATANILGFRRRDESGGFRARFGRSIPKMLCLEGR